ncbi:Nup133 N terminal like-domain-containing protein [Microdochium trichocladiopsis]|uniref:Nup133 N terminal like-domain-containing protein n=1 Tax=Microdochium trichocladiopsis TaxID=1682393 RepID=A0A9P9BMB5_9PEZI|nr:Nup133 N terminal like-domain-containing protein [Microdochium trichocladiopsis]KAH7026113.1 Nup133 N terminal like-domain-containing protein [Microdochium trichocladiopsis]
MFSPSQHNGSDRASTGPMTRGRRRQRPQSTDNSVQQPKAKRQRVPLNEQTFVNPDANIPPPRDNYEVKAAKFPSVDIKQDGIEAELPQRQPSRELSVRSKKTRPADRVNKGDGSTLLTTNSAFEVRKLPALPERLKHDATSQQHGSLDNSTGYALSVSHTHAIVWLYTAASQTPESFTFTLPQPSRHASDPLPIGSLVSPSASSSEPGLVVVMPTTGKIAYWESISSATTFDFMRQQRNGLEDSVTGMFSGETIIQLVNAESSAGFILTFSSGRLAYLSVRDSHGRPKISTQFLRTSLGPASSGFFGSIRHALSSAAQGDLAAVRAERYVNPGESTVVAATSKGKLHAWRIHRGGHHDVLAEVDARADILESIHEHDQESSKYSAESFKVLDFCFVSRNVEPRYAEKSELAQPQDGFEHLLLLTSMTRKSASRFVLVEVSISTNHPEPSVNVGMVRRITAYNCMLKSPAVEQPRLYLPKPNMVAFLVFSHAVVIASIAAPLESPDAQILVDSHVLSTTYEDVVDFRAGTAAEVIGSGLEEPHHFNTSSEEARQSRVKAKNPAVVLLLRGYGTIRISVSDVERFASETPPTTTAKSKLEQAVFFGVKDDSPLVFDFPREQPFSDAEYGQAALALSREILASRGQHLSTVAARVDVNIRERIRYLEKLMYHMQAIGIKLDRKTKWTLLWNAEKMFVAGTVWRKHEAFTSARAESGRKSLVAEVVEYIRKEQGSIPDPEKGEVDQVRHWFIRDIHDMELFLAWAYEVIKYNSRANLDPSSLTRFIFESCDVYNSAIRDAWRFRRDNLGLYGLSDEKIENGIIASDYAGLPLPWTCHPFITNNVKRQLELATEWVRQNWAAQSEAERAKQPLIVQTRELLPQVTEVYLTALQELSRSFLASDDPAQLADGHKYEGIYKLDRHDKIVGLAKSENWQAAIVIAEHHRSLPALAEILTREIDAMKENQLAEGLNQEQIDAIEVVISEKELKVKECFDKYGEAFAFPFYDYLFSTYGIDALLEYPGDRKYKTLFFRDRPELAKVSWINDIISEEDVDHAANTLVELGLTKEQQLWNKKIELSLGKLARLAEVSSRPSSKASHGAQDASVNAVAADARMDAIDRELAIITIQNDLYNTQIRPVISTALDEQTELDLALEAFPIHGLPKKYKILTQIFEDALTRLLKHEALDPLTLIDLLTLIKLSPDTIEDLPDQFFLALQVARNGLAGDERVQAERLIWRRCYLRADWKEVNDTSRKNDDDVVTYISQSDLFALLCTLYASGHQGDGVTYHRVSPSEALGVYTETLDRRWEKADKGARDKVLEAMRWEDSILRKHVEKHRLDQWAQETRKYAEDAVDSQYDRQTAIGGTADSTPRSPQVLVPKSPKKSPKKSPVKRQTRAAAANHATVQNGTAH